MENDSKYRLFYIAKLLYEMTDEDNYLTTTQIIDILQQRYGIDSHRQTIKKDIEILTDMGMDIQEIKSSQNRYNLVSRLFDIAELKLLIDAVESAKFLTEAKCVKLINKLCVLAGRNQGERLRANACHSGRSREENERVYLIIDAVNTAINNGKKISFVLFEYGPDKKPFVPEGAEEKIFSPVRLAWVGDYYYVLGFYDGEDEVKSIRLDRISQCPAMLEETARSVPYDFHLSSCVNSGSIIFIGKQEDVVLRCRLRSMSTLMDCFGRDIEVLSADEEYFNARVKAAVNPVFFGWCFAHADCVEILGPEEVKGRYRKLLYDLNEKLSGEN